MKETIIDLKTRRSCRKYTDRQIDEETLNTILEAGTYAPSGMGKQSARIVVTQNRNLITELGRLNMSSVGREGNGFFGAPTLIEIFADRNVHTYVHDGVLVASNIINAAHALGVDSCYVFRAKEMYETEEGKVYMRKWGLGEEYEGICNLVLGYRDEGGVKEPAPRKADYIVRAD